MTRLITSMDASFLLGLLFLVTFVGMATWEARFPARPTVTPLSLRWFGNITLFGMVWIVAGLLPFLSSYGAALFASRHGWGIFHLVSLPFPVALAASLVTLDFMGYWTHRLLHKIPLLWRLHALHHSDTDLDVSSTIRHHPVETIAQMIIDTAIALLFGFSPEAIILYGGVVLVLQTFGHGNVLLPPRLRWLSRWLITPDLHRLHHSVAKSENNSNFGNLVTLWDWMFGTLRRAPDGAFKAGLAEFPGAEFQRIDKLLLQPLLVITTPAASQNS